MRAEVIRVVKAYLEAVEDNDLEALPLHPDVVFESPLNSIRGIDAFREAIAKFAPILKSVEIEHLTADDEGCAAVLNLDTVFGVVPFLEYFRVKDGQIVSVRAYYDPRPMLERKAT